MLPGVGRGFSFQDLPAEALAGVDVYKSSSATPQGLDWRGLADARTTAIFYMAGRTAGRIAARLIEAGLPPDTPAAMVANVSRRGELRWGGPLAGLGDAAGRMHGEGTG